MNILVHQNAEENNNLSLPGEMVGGVGKEGEEKHQVLVEIFGGRAQGRHHMVENGQIGHFPSL